MTEERKESRIKVEDPSAETELTAEEAKNVTGGIAQVGLGVPSGYRESDFNFAIKSGDGLVKPQGS